MKSYILKIEFVDFAPLIWRRVILPADATFKRLHETIQRTSNFQSDMEDNHLYQFNLIKQENLSVTNDIQAYNNHKSVNKGQLKESLKNISQEDKFAKYEKRRIENLLVTVRQPQTIKIDKYLEKYEELDYSYDYGDSWDIKIKLEEIVDDYYFGYPTLLAGQNNAPPEDVGGMHGFYEFLKTYEDENDPNHLNIVGWANEQRYKEYDPENINSRLKFTHYKKTEWDKIKHKNHEVLEDKYVK